MCSSYYKILWHRQSKHTDIQIHPYDSTWYTFNKKSLAHLSLYRSPESISLIWVYIAHLSLYRSPESISLTWVYIAHLSLYHSPGYPSTVPFRFKKVWTFGFFFVFLFKSLLFIFSYDAVLNNVMLWWSSLILDPHKITVHLQFVYYASISEKYKCSIYSMSHGFLC